MRITPNNEQGGAAPIASQAEPQVQVSKPQLGKDEATMTDSQALDRAWERTPAVRPEKVAQAKALIKDASFPSDSQIGQLADLLAKHLSE